MTNRRAESGCPDTGSLMDLDDRGNIMRLQSVGFVIRVREVDSPAVVRRSWLPDDANAVPVDPARWSSHQQRTQRWRMVESWQTQRIKH